MKQLFLQKIDRIRLQTAALFCACSLHAFAFTGGSASSQSVIDSTTEPLMVDTTALQKVDSFPQKRSFFKKFIDYFADANKENPRKRFDFSVIGGPHYASDTKLGLGLVAAGIYRTDLRDTITPPSNVALYGDISTTGFYLLGIRGNHLFPQDRYRLIYNFYFFSFPGYYWGIGYDAGSRKENKTHLLRIQNMIKVSFLVRLAKDMYLGPDLSFDYVHGSQFDNLKLLQGAPRDITSYGAGLSFSYDSRDYLTNAYRGWYVEVSQRVYPKFMWNNFPFSRTEIKADHYQRLWKGAVLAMDLHAQFNYGEVPWSMMASVGGSNRMRGYYDGQYRDKNLLEFQVELRQHIWHRNGIAVWVGAGNVFPSLTAFDWSHTLPNYGVGYRWEFKKRVNVRLDYGFGKGTSAFIFNINEAF